MSNILKGRDSFDATAGNVLVPFFNRNITPYATEAGGPQFDLVPVEKQKDIMLNVARMHAQQEYDRIVELVRVLESQAQQIKRRLEITDAVHGAEYQFQTYHGQVYWLVYEREKQKTLLVKHGPNGWSSGPPDTYEYIAAVKWLGDHTWQEVNDV